MASVLVWVFAPSTHVLGQKSLSLTLSTSQLEEKVEKISGIPPNAQKITVDDARGQVFGDEDAVEKYEMSDDVYATRADSVRAFKQANKLGRFADTEPRPDHIECDPALKVGARCKIARDDQFERRGEIAYVGHTKMAPGIWVGVRYDEPVGKNDGQVQGERYFDAKPKHGGIVRPAMVTVGDFPVLNEWDTEFTEEDQMEL